MRSTRGLFDGKFCASRRARSAQGCEKTPVSLGRWRFECDREGFVLVLAGKIEQAARPSLCGASHRRRRRVRRWFLSARYKSRRRVSPGCSSSAALVRAGEFGWVAVVVVMLVSWSRRGANRVHVHTLYPPADARHVRRLLALVSHVVVCWRAVFVGFMNAGGASLAGFVICQARALLSRSSLVLLGVSCAFCLLCRRCMRYVCCGKTRGEELLWLRTQSKT